MHKFKTSSLLKGVQLAAMLLIASAASAANYDYNGDISLCTTTCLSFASLELGSTVDGSVAIDVGPSSSFTSADVVSYEFSITSSGALEPYVFTNPDTANPLPIDASVAVLEPTGFGGAVTGGTTDASGELATGTLLFRFTVPPFNDNMAWVVIDIATGTAQVCLFYSGGGCITGATEAVVVSGGFSLVPPADYNYDGDITLCTTTCLSFASLELGSTVDGSVAIDVGPSSSFTSADVVSYEFSITSSGALEPYVFTNPDTANPLPIDASVAVLEPTGFGGAVTGGTTDASGELATGTLLFRFTVPPFNDNMAWVVIDIATGTAQVCLFYSGGGCITGATEAVVVSGGFSLDAGAPDSDGDGVTDDVDNCTAVPNAAQTDTDGDGHGNICDADFDNNCVSNFSDTGYHEGELLLAQCTHRSRRQRRDQLLRPRSVEGWFLRSSGPERGRYLHLVTRSHSRKGHCPARQ